MMETPACTHRQAMARSRNLRLRLLAGLHRNRIDRQLADGEDPFASEDRALRARQLTDLSKRHRLAQSLRRVVARAESRGAALLGAPVPVCREAVLPWREALLGLADRLERPEPVSACGVARAVILIEDGAGPLFDLGPEHSIEESVWWVADGLTVRPANTATPRPSGTPRA